MRALALLTMLCALGGVAAGADAAIGGAPPPPAAVTLAASIEHYRNVTWRWQRTLGVPPTPADAAALRSPDLAYRSWVLDLWKRRAARVERLAAPVLVREIARDQVVVLHWQQVMAPGAGPLRETASAGGGLAALQRLAAFWNGRAQAVLRRAQHPPYEAQLLCVHRLEGAWTDGGGPYYGGLQMDLGFQQRYGAYLLRTKGTADKWTPLEQLWVGARAVRSGRGFSPWPNTARLCGLL